MDFLNSIVSALAGLAGVSLGGYLSIRNERARRKAEFVSKQLTEFYGPLLSIRSEIKARGELRVRLESAADQEWRKICAELDRGNPDHFKRAIDERRSEFEKLIEYENEQLRNSSMPAYRQMLALFRETLWLAEPTTRSYLDGFVEFVDVWERHLQQAIPPEVITAIGHSEAKLHPFYCHMEETVDRLRSQLSGASTRK